jgi:tetratricopeptide (TPR) repeat protein
MKNLCILILFVFLLVNCQQRSHPDLSAEIAAIPLCGTVQFTDGCSPQLDSLISGGLALVHHMTYEDAERIFDQVIQADKDCFWGHWGKAMTYIHPLWPDQPSIERLQKGWALSQRALALADTEEEKWFGQALASYYENGQNKTEKERLASYGGGWRTAYANLPSNLEAKLFHVLTRLATVPPDDKSYETQREAGAMAESVLEEIPDHPGGFHYAIHAYDFPPLATNAIRVAQNYSSIAPEIPHALHMPTHIFTRLGEWQESIDWNRRSANAAIKMPANGAVSTHYFHALDYLVYAYLQQANDKEAAEILTEVSELEGPFQTHSAAAYALAAMPARYALELRNWEQAAELPVRDPSHFAWDQYPQYEALTHFAKGIGAARSGATEIAREALVGLEQLKESMDNDPSNAYWINQIDCQKAAVNAWILFQDGKKEEGLAEMRKAADQEDAMNKNPVTPGELLPARELLADMQMEMSQPSEALENYQRTLESSPNRFNSLYGAGKAAEELGELAMARDYYLQLLQLTKSSSGERDQIRQVQSMVSGD